MTHMEIQGREISNIYLVDDDPEIREIYELTLEDLHINMQEINKVTSVQELLSKTTANDGFVCDFRLNTKRYSPIDGDIIVSSLYQKKVPAVLCSRDVDTVSSVRRLRHAIPCILNARELNSDTVKTAFEICIKEFSGNFSPLRRPWPTLIRFENIVSQATDSIRVAIVIPGWDSQTMLETDILSNDTAIFNAVQQAFASGTIFRCKALVNLDAESQTDVYIKDWVLV